MRTCARLGVGVAIFLLIGNISYADPPRYHLINLGDDYLGGYSLASGINSSGQVTGTHLAPSGHAEHGFLWDPSGTTRDLGALLSDTSTPTSINDSTQIVGRTGGSRPFQWVEDGTPDGLMTFLSTPNDGPGGAYGSNNLSQVVGYAQVGVAQHAALWAADGSFRDLGLLGAAASATSINDSSQVVGHFSVRCEGTFSSMHRAFLWQDDCQGGTMTDLGVPDGFSDSFAYHINDNGEAVGTARIGTVCMEVTTLADYRAARWIGGNWEILHTLDTPSASLARGSNNQGQVVGQLFDSRGVTVGSFLWQEGTMYDLSTLTDNVPPYFVFVAASAINEDGWIAGWGFFSNVFPPQPRAILWVPERSSHLR